MTGFCFFGVEVFCLEIVVTSKYFFLAFCMCKVSSVVEHSTADQEVGGSIPLAPFFIIMDYLSKDFTRLKDLFSSYFWTTKAHE